MADEEQPADLPGEEAPPPVEEAPPAPAEEPPAVEVEAPPAAEEAPPPPTEDAPPPPAEESPPPMDSEQGDLPPPELAEAEPDAPPALEKQPIVPLGVATSQTLLEMDLKPFILDKLFHEGKMARFTAADSSNGKVKDGGSAQYENHTWQLDHMFREVPKDMAAGIGLVRSKPDSLIYEEEKFILGKMERNLREEEGGYAPIAGKRESELEVNQEVTVPLFNLPKEPAPCRLPYIDEGDEGCGGGMMQQAPPPPPPAPSKSCGMRAKGKGGKVFEFAYSGVTAVSVGSAAGATGQKSCGRQQAPVASQCCQKSKGNEPRVEYKYPPVETRPSPSLVNIAQPAPCPLAQAKSPCSSGPQAQASAPVTTQSPPRSQCQSQARASAQPPSPCEAAAPVQSPPRSKCQSQASAIQAPETPPCQAQRQSGGSQSQRQSGSGGCQAQRLSGSGGCQAQRLSGAGGCQAPRLSGAGGCQAQRLSDAGGCQSPRQSEDGCMMPCTNPNVESHIQAVCDAARNAMAIYDTLTGIDNFPCNVGDRPELSGPNTDDGVWSWLYNLIVKLVPVETDSNCNNVPR